MNAAVQQQQAFNMKVVILAGGLGSRLAEETQVRPKPMVEIGGQPILWHIMMIYSHFGLTDFIICLGYKSYYIKEYFANFVLRRSDVIVEFSDWKTRIRAKWRAGALACVAY
jgi:glucose-1-phosphate cytidylyltransferase